MNRCRPDTVTGANPNTMPHLENSCTIFKRDTKMGGPSVGEGQTYCLKWNNHKSNLVEILDALIKMESYVDCTIVVDEQVQFKAHRVVLAANSPYFQSILQDVPMDHCSILFPGVQPFEMRALLEYMYTGEVNVTQSQIPKIMRIAEQLEVKGLFDMSDLKEKFSKLDEGVHPPMQSPSTPKYAANTNGELKTSSPQITTTSTNITSSAQSSNGASPPYNYKSAFHNMYPKSPNAGPSSADRQAAWPNALAGAIPPAAAAAMLNSVYESCADMNPLTKKKKLSSLSSMIMNRDTPILRNVLAQTHSADSSQPMPLVCPPVKSEKRDKRFSAPGNFNGNEYANDKKSAKYDEPHSPYTDRSFEEEGLEYPSNYGTDPRLPYGASQPNQKPEWKRYKQYTRTDILSAIECVRNGMSALQAARKFGVPSRTLYDKVKKMGITNGRPMNRTVKRSPDNGSNMTPFPYGLSGANHSYGQAGEHMLNEVADREKEHNHSRTNAAAAAALLDPAFLHAFEGRGGDIAGREALHAMALAAAAHAAVNGMSNSHNSNRSARSPSPGVPHKFSARSPSPPKAMDIERDREMDHEPETDAMDVKQAKNEAFDSAEEENCVEDLSLCRKEATSNPYALQNGNSVIVPAMTKCAINESDSFPIKRELVTAEDRD